MKTEVKITGVDKTLHLLQSLSAEIVSKRGGPVKLALAKGARVIRDKMKKNLDGVINKSRGESTGLLRKNIVIKRGRARGMRWIKGERYLVTVRDKNYPFERKKKKEPRTYEKGKLTLEYADDPPRTPKTAGVLEYGSSRQPAHPWIRPAFNAKAQEAISVTIADLTARIDKIIKKLSF
jgi:HK97 gp10 family phage protein